MSDVIKHECGIALLKLKKDLSYYQEKYGTPFYGLNRLYLLMEKQHNRGQDGAGVASIKFDVPPGQRYISRHRSNGTKPIQEVFDYINHRFKKYEPDANGNYDVDLIKSNEAFLGELYLGHLRYGTYGKNSIESCHPFLRTNNWMTKNLVLAGNFNMTNVDELFNLLVEIGQHPKEKADTVTVLEKIGHFLDEENERLFEGYKKEGKSYREISDLIAKNLNLENVLKNSSLDWDGGYVMAGLVGHGDSFVLRDPNGIRPAFWYEDDEIVVVTSERPVIQTVFNVDVEKIKELKPGHALVIKKSGDLAKEILINQPKEESQCSFERIYFSRGSDKDIYRERIALGKSLTDKILDEIDHNVDDSVFSFIPNTAETAFYGMIKGMEEYINEQKVSQIKSLGEISGISDEKLKEILMRRPRVEKIAIKDAKLRTFITQDDERDDFVAHVYDVTYGTVNEGKDNLVVIDDSIVRGTTLKQSILRILDRLNPKKIVVVSSAPQIRYPDCYGIDMSKMGDFIAFQAAISLTKERGKDDLINEVYRKCKEQENLPKEEVVNYVREIYDQFTADEISGRISELLKPKNINAELSIIYQTIEGLHKSCPNHTGDWYFSGNYPTPGGYKVLNKAFINYFEGKTDRGY